MEEFKDLLPPVALSLDVIDPNEGQMADRGLPENPRTIRDERFEQLKANITKYPQFLRQNSLIVYPYAEGRYLIIGGNQRYAALKELGYGKVPCHVLPADTPVENMKAFVVLDNSPFGQWDWMKLQSEDWDADQLQDWGVECDFLADDFFVEDEPDSGETLDDYKEPEKEFLECPFCHHKDIKDHFKKVNMSAGANEPSSSEEDSESEEESGDEDIPVGD